MGEIKETLRKLFKTGFFHIFGSNVINRIIGFLSGVILIRILTKNEYGVFTYAWNIYSIIILFTGMGVENGVLQLASEHSSDREYTDRVINYGTRFGFRFNLLLTAVILGIGLLAPLKIESGRPLLMMLCLLPTVELAANLITVYLRAQKRNQEYSRLNVISTISMLALSAGAAFLFREKGMVISHYLSPLLVIVLGYSLCHVHLLNRDRSGLGEERNAFLKISFISMCNNGLSQLMYLLDLFVLGIVDPQETILASYKVATSIPAALTFIPLALVTYLYPYFAEHKDDKDWCLGKYKKVVLGLGGLNLAISAVLFFAAPLVIRLVYGEQYLDAVPVFRILAVNYFFSGTFRILSGNLLVTQRKLKFNLIVAIISSSINVIADYFFIQKWGSIGAAWATVLVVIISGAMSTIYLVKVFRNQGKEQSSAIRE